MSVLLYVGNLAPGITLDQLRELFANIGPVGDVQFAHFDPTGQIADAALIQMEDHKAALGALRQLNGFVLQGCPLAVSPAEVTRGVRVTDELKQVAQQIAQQLDEDPSAQRRVERVVRCAGIEFARAIADEALAIEAQGGMLTVDGSRRRTPGGVFFYLVRGRISDELRREIFSFRKRKKATVPDPKAPEGPPDQPAQASRPAAAPSSAPPDQAEPSASVREMLAQLRQAHADAEQHLDEVRSNPPGQQAGLFSAMKAVVDLQKQIDTLLREYPQLKDA